LPAIKLLSFTAGVLAGIILGLFYLIFGEPLINESSESIFGEQRSLGLMIGSILLGGIFGLFYGYFYKFFEKRINIKTKLLKCVILALLLFFSIHLLPYLKYPPNPPGLGSEETVLFRQSFLSLLQVISIVLLFITFFFYRFLSLKISKNLTIILSFLFYIGIITLLFLSFPSTNVSINVSIYDLTIYRLISLAGLTFYWISLSLIFYYFSK